MKVSTTMKRKIPSIKEYALAEMQDAKSELSVARQDFNYATQDYMDMAIEALHIAELRYNFACKKLHKLCEDATELPKRSFILEAILCTIGN